jgi:hypothetical protein
MSSIVDYKQFQKLSDIEAFSREGEKLWALSLLATLQPHESAAIPSLIERLVELKIIVAGEATILEQFVLKLALHENIDCPYENEASIWHFAAKNRYIDLLHILNASGNFKRQNTLDTRGYYPLDYLLHNSEEAGLFLGSRQPLRDVELAHIWGISGHSTTQDGWSFSWEGASQSEMTKKFISYLEGFLQTDHVREPRKLRAVHQAISAFKEIGQSQEEKLVRIGAGVPTLFFTEWDDHVSVVGFLKNRILFKGNRGYRAVRREQGRVEAIRYYQINPTVSRGKLLSVMQRLEEGSFNYFEDGLTEDLKLRCRNKTFGKCSEIGNCSWVACKLALRAIFGDEELYKAFTSWVREESLMRYMQQSSEQPSEELLAKVEEKKKSRAVSRSSL